MALIKCSECGREISDKADKCIHCGCPLESKMNVQTVEQTSKKFKSYILLGSLFCFVGVFILFSAIFAENTPNAILGSLVGGTGLIMYFYGKSAAWWHHG